MRGKTHVWRDRRGRASMANLLSTYIRLVSPPAPVDEPMWLVTVQANSTILHVVTMIHDRRAGATHRLRY